MKTDTKENERQDDKNFQNTALGKQGQQKTASPDAHPFTENAEPDYADDLSTEEIGSSSDQQKPSDAEQQKLKVRNSDVQDSDKDSNPYDSENLDNESDSGSKDITEKDIEEDLINNDPSEGFETDIDAPQSDETQNGGFETIEPDHDNPVNKEFEIGELGNEELKEDERVRDETDNGAVHNYRPSQRKF
ncbi:hypothetical protein K6T82_03455 [Flavobacterium sp. 17A]|uniref:Uncharacterized protein n=2 Tax=Flavobacterium TaxID=237 RepID=A0A9X1H7Z6_9FLAO|nr:MULTISPECIES: hypothetical protein [Flavobacterium]MBW1655921.1 hypothetical protein [Flavobacterium quisquiliarum]MBZ4033807.1 hypothetical protein [Flavobacterium potami]WET03365.1 hypothetical protein P0R33_03305 [Flavobacterium sp. YJ01]